MSKFRISPHVSIYKFPITAMSSITNRIMGVSLSGCYVFGGTYCLVGNDPLKEFRKLDAFQKNCLYYGTIFPFVFHTVGGIRHYLWDTFPEHFLKKEMVSKSSWGLYGMSVILTYFTVEKYLRR